LPQQSARNTYPPFPPFPLLKTLIGGYEVNTPSKQGFFLNLGYNYPIIALKPHRTAIAQSAGDAGRVRQGKKDR